jgi:arginase
MSEPQQVKTSPWSRDAASRISLISKAAGRTYKTRTWLSSASGTGTPELRELGIPVWQVGRPRADDPARISRAAVAHLQRDDLDGFWVHLDADILDPSVMPAVDSPDPGGISHDELTALLNPLVAAPRCVGVQMTVFDPDLDPDGRLARQLTDTLVTALHA